MIPLQESVIGEPASTGEPVPSLHSDTCMFVVLNVTTWIFQNGSILQYNDQWGILVGPSGAQGGVGSVQPKRREHI